MTKSTRKYLWLALRILISGLCVAYVAHNVQWSDTLDADGTVSQGFLKILGNVFDHGNWPWLVAAVLAYVLSPLFGAWRWRLLLKIQNIHLTFRQSWRLTYIGFFFNTFMPGVTGGAGGVSILS